jgi:hypothetical protein
MKSTLSRYAIFSPEKTALNPSRSGKPEAPKSEAPPGRPVLMNSVRAAAITSVCMPRTDPLGTSRRGSIDSSAASGTSSIAR